MRRVFLLLAAIALTTSISAAPASAQKWDKNGRCHDASGKFAKDAACAGVLKPGAAMTAAPATKPAAAMTAAPAAAASVKSAKCKDAKGKFVKCTAAGAIPAK